MNVWSEHHQVARGARAACRPWTSLCVARGRKQRQPVLLVDSRRSHLRPRRNRRRDLVEKRTRVPNVRTTLSAILRSFDLCRSFSIAFCIIFYLTCTVPSLWIIHVDTANRKLYRLAENKLHTTRTTVAAASSYRRQPAFVNSTSSFGRSSTVRFVLRTATTPLVLSRANIECHDKVSNERRHGHVDACRCLSLRRGTTWRNNVGSMPSRRPCWSC